LRRYVLRLDHAEPPSTSVPRGGAGQFLQTRQIHRTRYLRVVMLRNDCSFFAICVWTSTSATSRPWIVPLPSTILPLWVLSCHVVVFHKSLPSSSLFEGGLRSSDRVVGSPSRQSVEQFDETRLVRITRGGFAIWFDPFGMLRPEVVVNLSPKLGVGMDFARHGHWSAERFNHGSGRLI
jgi:hypothetical protein